MKRTALLAIIAIIAILAGCEKKETKAADTEESGQPAPVSSDTLPQDDAFEIKLYTFMFDGNWTERPGRNPIWYDYETVVVSRSRMREDTFEYVKSLGITSHGDLRYCTNIRYEGNKLIVDFSGGIKQSMEGGGTAVAASAYKEQTVFQTLLSFPDVEELEFYIDGAQTAYWSDESGRSDFSYTRNAADMKKSLENYSYGDPENAGKFDGIVITNVNGTSWYYNTDFLNSVITGRKRLSFRPDRDIENWFFFGTRQDFGPNGTYIQNGGNIELTYTHTEAFHDEVFDPKQNSYVFVPITLDNRYTIVDTGGLFPSHKLVGESGTEWYLGNYISEEHNGKKRLLGDMTVYVHYAAAALLDNARVRNGPSAAAEHMSFYLAPGRQVTALPKGSEIQTLARSEHKTLIDNMEMPWYFCEYRVMNKTEPEWTDPAYGWIWGGLIDF